MNRSWVRLLPGFLRARLEGRAYLQNVVGNTGWQFGDQLLRMAIGLVLGIWLARYLGPEQFGLFSYALALVGMFAALASLGLDDIMVRDLVREPSGKGEILGTSWLLRLGGGAISMLAATGTIFLLRPDESLSRWLVGIIAAGALFQSFSVIEFWFHSQVQARYAVLAKQSAFLGCSLLKIGLIMGGASLFYFAWVALLEVMLGAAALVLAYRLKSGPFTEWRFNPAKARKLLHDSWPLMLAGMVVMVYLRIDQLMLGELAGHRELGIYAVAVRLAEVWWFIPTALYWSLFPAIIEAKAGSEELFYQRLQKFYNLAAFTAYLVAVPVALAAQWLVPLLFGAEYAEAGLLLTVLVWANVFAALEVARSSFLTVMNWTRLYLVTVFLGGLLNIGLNYWLIPLHGGMGAVVASLVAYWFAAHGSCFLFRPLRRTGGMLSRALVYPKIW